MKLLLMLLAVLLVIGGGILAERFFDSEFKKRPENRNYD